jgi:hypothetical protein
MLFRCTKCGFNDFYDNRYDPVPICCEEEMIPTGFESYKIQYAIDEGMRINHH